MTEDTIDALHGREHGGERIHIVDPVLRHGYTQVPRLVLRAKALSDKAKLVYALLLDYAWQQGSCFPGQQRLAQDLDTTERTIRRCLQELKRFLLIDWKRRGLSQTNVYYILPLAESSYLADPEADRTFSSAQKRTSMSDPHRTSVSDKEDTATLHPDVNLRNSKANAKQDRTTNGGEGQTFPNTPDHSPSQAITPSRTRSSTVTAHRFSSIAGTLTTMHPELTTHPPTTSSTVEQTMPRRTASPQLTACIADISQEYGDRRHLRSNLTQTLHLLDQTGLEEGAFVSRLYEARAITNDRRRSATTTTGQYIGKPMPYFFRVVQDLLGVMPEVANSKGGGER